MKKIITLILLISTSYLFAQGEAANWFFGNGAGLSFDLSSGNATPNNLAAGTINTNEGCSSISDVNGNLLFYTDGRNIWDRNFQIMPNADYVNGTGLLGDPSSTSSGLIIPKPGNPLQYYVFTVDEPHHNNAWAFPNQGPASINGDPLEFYEETYGNFQSVPIDDDGYNNGLSYSLVDLTLNSGFGDVDSSEKNVPLVTYDINNTEEEALKCSEKITAVEHADGNSYWVITQFTDKFYAFRVADSGVNTEPSVSQVDPLILTDGYRRNAIGYMKSSPDGTKLAICHAQNINQPSDVSFSNTTGSLWIYDFNNATGEVSNPINFADNLQVYGVEFSAGSKKVYASTSSSGAFNVVQYDLDNDNEATTILSQSGGGSFIAALQLAPNGKIYVANQRFQQFLDVIENPEEPGLACSYLVSGQELAQGTDTNLGLPPFIQSFLLANIQFENTCLGDTTMFTAESSETILDILWDFGDSTTSTDLMPTHTYASPGEYTVTVTIVTATETQTFSRGVTIYEIPVAFQPQDLRLCDQDNDGVFNFDLTTITSEILNSQDADTYSIHYFTSEEDADNFENEITGSFQNQTNPQQVFARIHNIFNNSCYDTIDFNFEVFNTPIANIIGDYEVCEDFNDADPANGQTDINLEPFIATILGTQNPDDYSVTFHPTQNDAISNTSQLPLLYYNTNPINDTIYYRIENNLNTDCFDISVINFVINPLPEAFDTTLVQCDEDGIPEGFTIFNLTQATEAITNGQSNLSLRYFTTLIDVQNNEDPIDPDAFNNWLNPQIIYVEVSNDLTSCTNIAELTLEVSTTSISDFTPTPLCDELGSEDGINTFQLSEIEQEIQSLNSITLPIVFYETYLEALLEENSLANTYINTAPYLQTIYARAENNNACFGIAEIDLKVYKLPQIQPDTTVYYCLNEYPNTVLTLSGAVTNDILNDYYYEWFFNGTNLNINEAEITINDIGAYKVIVTSTEGCSKERTITVAPSNIAEFNSIEVTDGGENNVITVLLNPGEGTYQYAVDDPNGPYQDSNVFENVLAGFHTVYVKDIKNNCGIVNTIISVIGFPKFFTPNGDSYNERWHVRGVSEQFQPNSKIRIFNRFGKLMSALSPSGPGWDGTHNGSNMPSDDYWFFVILQDGRVFKNHFSLKR